MTQSPPNKISRNDLCSCGSGKKYKKCCLVKDNVQNITDFEWRKFRQTEGEVVDKHLLPFVKKNLPAGIFQIAWCDFLDEVELPEEAREALLIQTFYPWALFDWPVELYEDADLPEQLEGKTIAQYYLETYPQKLSDYERRFIEAMGQTYYSFYVALDVIPQQQITLRDVILKTEHTVKEKSASQAMSRGDIVYSRILTLDDQSIFIGMAPFPLPARIHHELIEFRKDFEEENGCALTPKTLRDFERDVRTFFLNTVEYLFYQPKPTLCNTDGDLIVLCKVRCKLAISPREALQKLMPLTLSNDMEEFLPDAKKDKSGSITRLQFPWLKKGNTKHKDWDNTVMGHITIQKDNLTAEVNSETRAKQIQKLLTKYLGDDCENFRTIFEPLDNAKDSAANRPSTISLEDLNNHPEVNAIVQKTADEHWKNWFHTSIPALNNQTPREAAKTEVGRELLEALLLHYENNDKKTSANNLMRPNIEYLRKELGLLCVREHSACSTRKNV